MNAALPPSIAPILAGDRRTIARAISAIENAEPGAEAIARAIASHLGRAHVLGITGAPGAGKSTLINAVLGELLARGQRIAVVAVDPSSPVTGGAVLGDRVRMGEHGAHDSVFIRSVASRGHPGGVSRTTAQIIDVLDAGQFDTVIVETVGAGQSEVAITGLADTRLVVCPPGLGDNVQAIKAGILEIADILVVSKGDLPASATTVRDLEDMLHLRRATAPAVPVLKTAATTGAGIAAIVDAVFAHAATAGRGRRLSTRETGGVNEVAAADDLGTFGAARLPAKRRAHSATYDRVLRLAARDPCALALGIRCVDAAAGRAAVSLTIRDAHINFNGACHGGVIFALADTAFGLASNSHGMIAVGIDAHITYHVATQLGDMLTATAIEVSRSRKIAVYRVDVKRSDETLISSFTGTVYVTPRSNEVASDHG